MKPGEFPLQDRCDLDTPEEAFVWMMVALPRMNGGALPMSSEYMQLVSKHLWKCGARVPHNKANKPHHQKQWWRAPSAGDPHWLTNPGRWVKSPEEAKTEGPNMVTVLEAMKKADEGGFFAALDQVMGERNDD